MKRDLARELFRSFKDPSGQVRRRRRPDSVERNQSEEKNPSSDPLLIKNTLAELVQGREWEGALAEGNLFSSWSEIVGIEIAEHAEPVTFFEGVLTLRASSTAWATQLNLLKPTLLKKINQKAPTLLVEAIEVVGPRAPSWKKGLRTIKGARGPRDTYG